MTDLDVISIGNLNMDLIGKLEKLPDPDEKVLLDDFARRPGGGAANFAVACSKLGLKTEFLGCVGSDKFGEEIIADLKKNGVKTSFIKKVEAPTGLAFIFLDPRYERYMIEYRGANSHLDPNILKDGYMEGLKILHTSSVSPQMALEVGKKSEEFDVFSSLDFGAELTELESGETEKIMEVFDVCFMNEETFEKFFGVEASEENVKTHIPSELKYLVVTQGPRGAISTDGKTTSSSPGFDVDVKDTTGAGDAFAAAFDNYITEGSSLEDSTLLATAEAAIKIQHVGARIGLPTKKELKKFLKSHA